MLKVSYIAERFFGRSRSWLTHKLNHDIKNGKPDDFTPEERRKMKAPPFTNKKFKIAEIMMQVKVFLYREKDGSYSCYMDKHPELNYGLIGEGQSVQEAIDDWMKCYEGMREAFADGQRGEFKEAEFTFAYDLASILNYYAGRFTFAGLARITGVSAAQLSQYANGYRHPSPSTTRKIQDALHVFGKELCQVTLV